MKDATCCLLELEIWTHVIVHSYTHLPPHKQYYNTHTLVPRTTALSLSIYSSRNFPHVFLIHNFLHVTSPFLVFHSKGKKQTTRKAGMLKFINTIWCKILKCTYIFGDLMQFYGYIWVLIFFNYNCYSIWLLSSISSDIFYQKF